MTLDTARVSTDSVADHVDDHNTLHEAYNGWENFYQAQFVDPANGSDSNDGSNPGEAKATIEAAYGDLTDDGGVIELAPHQDHDVGDGLEFDRRKATSLIARARPRRNRGGTSNRNTAPRLYSSTGAATLVSFPFPANTVASGTGFEFLNIDFLISTTTTLVFDAEAMSYTLVQGCGAYHDNDDATEAAFQFFDGGVGDGSLGDDASWCHLLDNYVRGGTLIRAGASGTNLNRWRTRDNVVFSINATDPKIELSAAHGCFIGPDNLEGDGIGVKLTDGSRGNRIDGVGGEDADPYVLVDDSYGNLITPIGVSDAGETRTLVRFTDGASDNIVLAAVATGKASLPYGHAGWIDDQTTDKNNWIYGSSGNVTAANTPKLRTLGLADGRFAPSTISDVASLYVDQADGDLKVKFGDGTVKTIATDS